MMGCVKFWCEVCTAVAVDPQPLFVVSKNTSDTVSLPDLLARIAPSPVHTESQSTWGANPS